MPQRIEVPGMGVVEFPDGMSDAQIAAAIQQNMPPKQGRGVIDQLTGRDGQPRYQLWPERLARGVAGAAADFATLPGRVLQEAQQAPPQISDSDVSVLSVPQAMNFAGFATPINPMARSGDKMLPGTGMAPSYAKPPSTEALKGAAEAQYKAAGDMGVEIASPSVGSLSQNVQAQLEKDGIFAELAPKTFSVLKRIQNPPEGSFATVENLNAVRRSLGLAARDFTNKTEQLAAQRAMDALDNFISNVPEGAVLAGPAAAAGKTLEAARGNYAAAMRSNKITGQLDDTFGSVLDRADLNAAVANSGQNVDNALRQRIRDILVRPKEAAGYSAEELKQMERVARGSVPANAARFTGNLLGGGGGLGAVVAGGAGAAAGMATGNPAIAAAGATAPAVGYAAKQLANALTKREVGKLDEMIRMRSPLYESMPKQPVYPATQDAIIRALLGMQLQQQQ